MILSPQQGHRSIRKRPNRPQQLKFDMQKKTGTTMIDVAIDLNLHHEGPSDGLLTCLYTHNWKTDPLAARFTIIIANRTEKVPCTEHIFY